MFVVTCVYNVCILTRQTLNISTYYGIYCSLLKAVYQLVCLNHRLWRIVKKYTTYFVFLYSGHPSVINDHQLFGVLDVV